MPSRNLPPHLPYNPSLKEKTKQLRNNPTPAERTFWNAIRRMPFYQSITINRQKPIGNFIVDFYCHQFKLVFEIDGHSHGESKAIIYDQKRVKYLETKGLTVIRFTNWDVEKNIQGVMEKVEQVLNKQKIKSP